MDDWFEEDYQDYLASYQAWGHQYVEGPLDFDTWMDLRNEVEELDIEEECDVLSAEGRKRREDVQRLLLEHETFFEEGPRVVISRSETEDPQ